MTGETMTNAELLKILERTIKAVVNWNGMQVEFSDAYLELQDHFDLQIEISEGITILKTSIRETP